ncbi:hypothetical protein [Blastococcus brunescens]|uniref:Uncharacterized protein n=1 Tax=Blastococcus brunescens TaxID=1564165 RepID=A0ABZ1AXU8_9ACTN|nr:hypothetical protein [Blastococcus sp. BMG 8361]WRL63284.1 hypothetical protein U6N30_26540 [Blastococcus sp. BMG 8361]
MRAPLAADALQLIHDDECAVHAVAEVLDIAVTGIADDGDALTGTLVLTRREGDDAVTASSLTRSVLVDVVAEELPLELGAGSRAGGRRCRSARPPAIRTCCRRRRSPTCSR